MFEPGALVLVPYPFSDLTSAKRRPVLALTAPDPLGDFIGCPVTSREGRSGARPLRPEDVTDRVVTLHAGLVVKRFGRVSDTVRVAVASEVCRFIGAGESAAQG